ncbi:hypothetical protein NODU109028_14095 [Nocardioides dubius]|uniref:CcmD family protein n=1 Tax=Nocardioides dubius TaxID=317019 RepID=A0ABN1TZL0_9ACTN
MTSLFALVISADSPPEAKDVVAGWTALWIFVGLAVAVALLCWSLVRQLKKAERAKAAGVYGDPVKGERGDGDAPNDQP